MISKQRLKNEWFEFTNFFLKCLKQICLSYKTLARRSLVLVNGGTYVHIDTICQNGTNSTRIVTAVSAANSKKYKNLRHKILKSNVKILADTFTVV